MVRPSLLITDELTDHSHRQLFLHQDGGRGKWERGFGAGPVHIGSAKNQRYVSFHMKGCVTRIASLSKHDVAANIPHPGVSLHSKFFPEEYISVFLKTGELMHDYFIFFFELKEP